MSLPRAETFIDISNSYQRNLYSALKHVITTVRIASNRMDDYLNSAAWSFSLQNPYKGPGKWKKITLPTELTTKTTQQRNFTWRFEPQYPNGLPLSKCAEAGTLLSLRRNYSYCGFDTKLSADTLPFAKSVYSYPYSLELYEVIHTVEKRAGNCHHRALLLLLYLWEHSTGIERLEIANLNDTDHVILIVNREIRSQLNQPETWGENAWVIDAWYMKDDQQGTLFPASQLKEKIVDIIKFSDGEVTRFIDAGLREMKSTSPKIPEQELIKIVTIDVDVNLAPYPYGRCRKGIDRETPPPPEDLLNFFDLFKFKFQSKEDQKIIKDHEVKHKLYFFSQIKQNIQNFDKDKLRSPKL